MGGNDLIIECEAFKPKIASIQLIENSIIDIKPEKAILYSWLNSYVQNQKTRIAFDLDIIKNNIDIDKNILEFGSVPLLLTNALVKTGYQVTGIDIAPERFNSTIKSLNINIIKCDIERQRLPIEDNSYDLSVFNELFEHLRINPIFTMSEVLRVLKPSGILLLSTPNLRSLKGIINFLFKNQAFSSSGDIFEEYEKLDKLGHMGHVREYTSDEVVKFLNKVGFNVEKLIFRGRYRLSRIPASMFKLFPKLNPFITYFARKTG
ncbi:hypothetical protein DAMNIGENAA_08430 [Desulforhabdus amnigena]|uniref:Methyltransferase type 11 domain-containing protein n=1 Tax=Desulforhabdus amnigena TaxID=40218 RepID=A0A9W6FTA7_9BACT|nr:hypothetical protein DAMNIGENAA_08430 [Desulforhabdus amnigena]